MINQELSVREMTTEEKKAMTIVRNATQGKALIKALGEESPREVFNAFMAKNCDSLGEIMDEPIIKEKLSEIILMNADLTEEELDKKEDELAEIIVHEMEDHHLLAA